jgi:hypothetical protein
MHAYSVSRGQRAARDSRHARLHARSIVTLVHAVHRVAALGPVPAQMWQGRAQSRRRCGAVSHSPRSCGREPDRGHAAGGVQSGMAQVAGVGAADPANGIAMDATAALAQIRRARHTSSGRTPDDTWRGTACNAARGTACNVARHATRRVSWHATRHVARQCNAARCVAAAGAVRLDAARPRGPRGLDAKHP